MSELSSHTKLMNTIICLSTRSHRFYTPVLYENHYELETIECSFNKIDGDIIDADIVLKNPELKNLFIMECKAGGLEKDQAERYSTLNKNDIVNANITTLGGEFTFEIAYLTDSENKEKLIKGINENSLNFPIIFLDNDKLKLACNSINCSTLHDLFSNNGGITVPKNPPLMYYPFGKDDSDAHILSCIGPVLMQIRGQEFDVEDLLLKTHRIYEYFSDAAVKSLKGRLGKLINDLKKGDLNEFFDQPKSKPYSLKDFGPKRFQKKLEQFIEKSNQNPLKETQLLLGKFGNLGENNGL